jgi:hypothetical protein
MPGKVIGKYFNNGFPGTFAEQGDRLIPTFANTGDAEMDFGAPVFSYSGGVAVAGSTGVIPTAASFKGVAVSHVQTALSYTAQSMGQYPESRPVPVMERGGVAVCVSNAATNAPAIDGNAYVRIANGTTAKPVGGFEAAADSTTYTATVTTQTSGSAAVVVSSVASLALGMTVSGTGIASGSTITAINSGTLTITLSAAATTTASSGTLTFGGNTVQITNATFGSTADANGVAMLVIKSRNNS